MKRIIQRVQAAYGETESALSVISIINDAQHILSQDCRGSHQPTSNADELSPREMFLQPVTWLPGSQVSSQAISGAGIPSLPESRDRSNHAQPRLSGGHSESNAHSQLVPDLEDSTL